MSYLSKHYVWDHLIWDYLIWDYLIWDYLVLACLISDYSFFISDHSYQNYLSQNYPVAIILDGCVTAMPADVRRRLRPAGLAALIVPGCALGSGSAPLR